ncbi:MAG: JAB domain-containing protein [Sarcina sp.]
MRLTKYKIEMVKEESCNYGGKEFKIKNPWDIYKAFIDVYELHKQTEEVFFIACLDTKNKIIGIHEVSRGTLNSSLVHPREVFKRALINNASKIILAHNHPSMDLTPSIEDKKVTKRLIQGGEVLGIEVIDHIIIGDGTYYSFKENLEI